MPKMTLTNFFIDNMYVTTLCDGVGDCILSSLFLPLKGIIRIIHNDNSNFFSIECNESLSHHTQSHPATGYHYFLPRQHYRFEVHALENFESRVTIKMIFSSINIVIAAE